LTGKIEKDESIRISCPACKKVYRLPKDSIPPGKKVYVTCPNCKTKILVRGDEPGGGPGQLHTLEVSREGIEYFDRGSRVALVACEDSASFLQIEKALDELDYEYRAITTTEELENRFRYFVYPLVILFQHGTQTDPEMRRMLEVINRIPQEARRRAFVAYIHPNGNRFDSLQAFSMGCDLTLSPLDLPDLSSILKRAMTKKYALYRVLDEVAREAGQDALVARSLYI